MTTRAAPRRETKSTQTLPITGEEFHKMGNIGPSELITGVDRVWIVEPETKSVLVYEDSTTIKKYEPGDVVAGEGQLEGFEIPVDDIFAV